MPSFTFDLLELLGYAGGTILAFASLPQVLHTYKTQSTKDISYGWQISTIAGLSLTYVYFLLKNVTAAWVTLTVELVFALLLFGMKLRLDGWGQPKSEPAKEKRYSTCNEESATGDIDSLSASDIELAMEEEDFHGIHCEINSHFTNEVPLGAGTLLLEEMKRLGRLHKMQILCPYVDLFDSNDDYAFKGFAVSALIGTSHCSAVCNFDQKSFSLNFHAKQQGFVREFTRDVLTFIKTNYSFDEDSY